MARKQDPKLARAQAKAIDMETLGRMLGMFDAQDRMDLERERLSLDKEEMGQRADLARRGMENQEQIAAQDREARLAGSKSALLNARANLLSQTVGQPEGSPVMRLIAAADPEFAKVLESPSSNSDQQLANSVMEQLNQNRKDKGATTAPRSPVMDFINLPASAGTPGVAGMQLANYIASKFQ